MLLYLHPYTYRYYVVFTDIDECSVGIHTCPETSFCLNSQGSYHCSCTDNYISDKNCIGKTICFFDSVIGSKSDRQARTII